MGSIIVIKETPNQWKLQHFQKCPLGVGYELLIISLYIWLKMG